MTAGNHYYFGCAVPPAYATNYFPLIGILGGTSGFYLEQLDIVNNRDKNDSQSQVVVQLVVSADAGADFPTNANHGTPVIPGTPTSQSKWTAGNNWGLEGTGEQNLPYWSIQPGEQKTINFCEDRQPFIPSGSIVSLWLALPGFWVAGGGWTGADVGPSGGTVSSILFINAWICEPTS